ncbi:hypothetical protein Tco_0686884 [Tanacetum coccineum]
MMIFCTIKSKPLALPWRRTPRLDSDVRIGDCFNYVEALLSFSYLLTCGRFSHSFHAALFYRPKLDMGLLTNIKHCFVSLDAPLRHIKPSGSGSALVLEFHLRSQKAKRKKVVKAKRTLYSKSLRTDHPSLASGTGREVRLLV